MFSVTSPKIWFYKKSFESSQKYLKRYQEIPKVIKSSAGMSNSEPKGHQKGAKSSEGRQRERKRKPKGTKTDPKVNQRAPNNY